MSSDIVVHTAGAPAVTGPPSPLEWRAIQEQANVIAGSGLAPRGVDTPEKVMVIALKGRELGVPPMQALSHVHVIEGKPTMSSELMVALVQRAGHKIRVRETSSTQCVVEGVRADDPDSPATVTFTWADAEAAKVAHKDTWKKYPAAMLRARAISGLCRFQFADVLMGCSYTPEELGADVDDDGSVIDVTAAYMAPDHAEAMERLDALIADAELAGVEGDYDAAREYARKSTAHAEAACRKVGSAMVGDADETADVVEAEVVEDTDPEPEPAVVDETPAEDPSAGDAPPSSPAEVSPPADAEQAATDPAWRDVADQMGVGKASVLNAVRNGWESNSQWNKPNRLADIDRLAADADWSDRIADVIGDLHREQASA